MKTSELIGPALDWAVAKCAKKLPISHQAGNRHWWSPSTNWNHGGPIIERLDGFQLKIWLESSPDTKCEAHIHASKGDWIAFGPTPLIATMRCFVASKLGNEVDVPEELL